MRKLFLVGGVVAVNPIRKVVTLMQEMQKEIEAEGDKEKELFEKFMCYCKGNNESLEKQAADSAAAGAEFRAKVEAESSEKKQVDQDLAQAKKDRADAKADLAKATKLREKENKQYMAENADGEANLAATGNAINALEKGMGASLLQTKLGARLANVIGGFADKLESYDKEALAAFLEQSKDYAPQSGQIVGILKNMKDEMEKSLGETRADEKAALKAFTELAAAKNKEIAATTAAVESQTKRSGELAVSIVQNKNAAEDSEEESADATNFLANLKKTCAEKQKEYDTRVATRADEIEAIGMAIGILNNDDALDLFKKTLKTPAQAVNVVQPQVFLQTRVNKSSALTQARNILASTKYQNAAVALISSSVVSQIKSAQRSGKADFSKVVKMIDDMVALLGQEQKDDAKHRDWCNAEFDTSEDEEKDLNGAIKALSSSISQMKDEIAALTSAIEASHAKVADLDKSVAEATKQREEEHAEFTQTLQANEMAIELIGKAKNKLLHFYNPELAKDETQYQVDAEGNQILDPVTGKPIPITDAQGRPLPGVTPVAFIQTSMKTGQPAPPPETFSGEYSGKGKKSGGVMALMDKLIKELETDVGEAKHDEEVAQKDYEELSADAATSKAEETKAITNKSKSKADQEANLEEAKRGHSLKSEALAELKGYVAELHQSCDFILENFEERKEARGNEVEGLKRAKAVLAGADYK